MMTDPITSERFGNRRIPKMLAQVNAHRAAVAAEGTPLIQDTWDKIEEHIDFAYAKNAAPAVPDDVAKLAADCRTAAKIMGDLDTFPTGQGILRQSADTIETQAAELARLRAALKNIAEGNLGDQPWQANYNRIRDVAAAALTHPTGD